MFSFIAVVQKTITVRERLHYFNLKNFLYPKNCFEKTLCLELISSNKFAHSFLEIKCKILHTVESKYNLLLKKKLKIYRNCNILVFEKRHFLPGLINDSQRKFNLKSKLVIKHTAGPSLIYLLDSGVTKYPNVY